MKALSIRQPWAFSILHLGKDVENRKWGTSYRGPLLIHAAKGCTADDVADWWAFVCAMKSGRPVDAWDRWPGRDTVARGAIVGIVDLVGCFVDASSPWFVGPVGLAVARPRAFAEPIPYRGQLGLFDVPHELVRDAIAQARPK